MHCIVNRIAGEVLLDAEATIKATSFAGFSGDAISSYLVLLHGRQTTVDFIDSEKSRTGNRPQPNYEDMLYAALLQT